MEDGKVWRWGYLREFNVFVNVDKDVDVIVVDLGEFYDGKWLFDFGVSFFG